MTTARIALAWAAAAALLLGSPAAAGDRLPRLPADRALPQGEGSPAPVTFSHASHVDPKKPACLTCHPRTFRILETGHTASGQALCHELMERGAGCGACHGKTAFGFDTCELCHK